MIMGKRNKMAVKNKRKNNNNKKKTHFSRRRYAGCWIDDFLLALSNWFFLAASSFPPLSSSSRWFSSKHACSISVALTNLSQTAQMLAAQNAKPLERRAEGNFWILPDKGCTYFIKSVHPWCSLVQSLPHLRPTKTLDGRRGLLKVSRNNARRAIALLTPELWVKHLFQYSASTSPLGRRAFYFHACRLLLLPRENSKTFLRRFYASFGQANFLQPQSKQHERPPRESQQLQTCRRFSTINTWNSSSCQGLVKFFSLCSRASDLHCTLLM